MTLEEAIAWCIEHSATLIFYKNNTGEKKVMININGTVFDNHNDIKSAVSTAIAIFKIKDYSSLFTVPGD